MAVTILVLFNLKKGRAVDAYEDWAKTTDLPIVRKLDSIDRFDVFRCSSILGSDAAAPYEYAEILEVNDMDVFNKNVSTETMQSVANQFQAFADDPIFILTENIEGCSTETA